MKTKNRHHKESEWISVTVMASELCENIDIFMLLYISRRAGFVCTGREFFKC